MKTLGCGIIVALVLPLVFGCLVLFCYGFKLHQINAASHRRYEAEKARRALEKSLEPPQPYSKWSSTDGRYVFRYFKDDFEAKRKRVELRDLTTGQTLLQYQTEATIDCAWRKDSRMLAVERYLEGKFCDTTVYLFNDGKFQSVPLIPIVKALVPDPNAIRHWDDHRVGLMWWKGDNLQVNYTGRRRPKDSRPGSRANLYQLILTINFDGRVHLEQAKTIHAPRGSLQWRVIPTEPSHSEVSQDGL